MGSSGTATPTPQIGVVLACGGGKMVRDGATPNALVVTGTNFGVGTMITLSDPTGEKYVVSVAFNPATSNMEGTFTADKNNLNGIPGLCKCQHTCLGCGALAGVVEGAQLHDEFAVAICLTTTATNNWNNGTLTGPPNFIEVSTL